jgi:hypothetical protein
MRKQCYVFLSLLLTGTGHAESTPEIWSYAFVTNTPKQNVVENPEPIAGYGSAIFTSENDAREGPMRASDGEFKFLLKFKPTDTGYSATMKTAGDGNETLQLSGVAEETATSDGDCLVWCLTNKLK